MQVLLDKDVKKLGYRGDVVSVKPGFYRNFLSPNGLAKTATAAVMKLVDSRRAKLVMEKQQLLDNAKEVIAKLKGLKVVIKSKASDKGKLYGAVAEAEVVLAVEKAVNMKLEKDFVKMDHIKDTGEFKVHIDLGKGFEEDIDVVVEAE